MLAVPVSTKPTFSRGPPQEPFTLAFIVGSDGMGYYDRAPDRRLLIVRGTARASTVEHVNVVLDWCAGLQCVMAED